MAAPSPPWEKEPNWGRPEPSLGKEAPLGAAPIPPWEAEAAEPAVAAISPREAGAEPEAAAVPPGEGGAEPGEPLGREGARGLGVRPPRQMKNSGPVISLRFLMSCRS